MTCIDRIFKKILYLTGSCFRMLFNYAMRVFKQQRKKQELTYLKQSFSYFLNSLMQFSCNLFAYVIIFLSKQPSKCNCVKFLKLWNLLLDWYKELRPSPSLSVRSHLFPAKRTPTFAALLKLLFCPLRTARVSQSGLRRGGERVCYFLVATSQSINRYDINC